MIASRIACLLAVVLANSPSADWKLKKDKEGIAVYTRSVEASDVAEFKAVMSVEGTNLQQVLEVLTNVDGYKELFPDCSEARLLEREGRYNIVHYSRTKAPFPVDDRDGIYQLRTTISANNTKAVLALSVLPDRLPRTDGVVRIPAGSGKWEVEQIGRNVKILYQFHADPGGSVPTWLVNSAIVDTPYNTMVNLRRMLLR